MIDDLLAIVAPHPCSGCGKTGTLLCDNCKYNINMEKTLQCMACGSPAGVSGVCNRCSVPSFTMQQIRNNAGSNRTERIAQAKVAFGARAMPMSDALYLLIDDVVTTGAAMECTARALRDAGATTIWAAAIARQPLD